MAWITAVVGVAAALGGIVLGGVITRRNEKRAQGERLLVEALNDAMTAIAQASAGGGAAAQARYGSATARIALHASPLVLTKFREFQEIGRTTTLEGRTRLLAAIKAARNELGNESVDDDDIAFLIFGHAARHEPT